MLYEDYKAVKAEDRKSLILFLASLCFFLSAIENSIPKPLPFMRLGLANAPIIFALFLLQAREYFFLVLIKILGQALVSGTIFSYIILFSAGGSIASAIAMFLLQRLGKKQVSCLGISLLGSLANTLVQYILARYLLFGAGAVLIAPLLLVSGSITGIILGLFSEFFLKQSKWFSLVQKGKSPRDYSKNSLDQKTFPKKKKSPFRLKSLLMPFLVFSSIVLFNLFQAYGKVLFSFWGFEITSGALMSGIKRASILTGMVFLSKLIVSSSFRLPGKWGAYLDHIFYYLAVLTEKNIANEEKSLEEAKKKSKLKLIFSQNIFKAIDTRLLEVYF